MTESILKIDTFTKEELIVLYIRAMLSNPACIKEAYYGFELYDPERYYVQAEKLAEKTLLLLKALN